MKKTNAVNQRQKRVRSSLTRQAGRPRLTVFRSSRHTYAQAVDDSKGVTLFGVSTKIIKSGTKTEKAARLGELIAEKAVSTGVSAMVFDRGARRFHGRLAALAQAARAKGLKI